MSDEDRIFDAIEAWEEDNGVELSDEQFEEFGRAIAEHAAQGYEFEEEDDYEERTTAHSSRTP